MAAEYPHAFPLTQASERSPNIFVDASGFSISVYLDVNPEIFGRPRLIRLLRTSGADISHSPTDASIILINPETESGLKFVHDWSADTHKTVLNYGWIQACLQSGHALLEVDDWGGFRVPHAPDCVYSEDDEEEEDNTPVVLKRRQTQTAMHPRSPSPVSPIPGGRHAKSNRPNQRVSNPLPARSSHKPVSSIATAPSPRSVAGTNSQNTPAHRQPAPASSKHTLPSSAPPQQSTMPQSHMFPRTGVMSPSVPLPIQVPGTPASQMFPLATNNPDPQQSSTDPLNLLHALNSAYQFQNAASQTLTQLVETIIAVAQRQGIDTSVIQNYLATLPMTPSLHHPSSSLASQSLHAQSPTPHSSSEKPVASISDLPPGNVDQSPSRVPTPRRPAPESPPPVKRRKTHTEPLQVKKATSYQQQNLSEAVSEPEPTRGIFSAKNGQPIVVFVQVDTRGRHEFVHLIKKNGGQITADIPTAGFVILNPRSVSYADLRREAEDSGRTIVQTTFITESIREGHLMDPNDYLLEDTRVKKPARGGRRTSSHRDKHSPESDHEASEAQTSDTVVDTLSPALARDRSVTPEPPMAVQLKKGYKFTPAEMSYTWMLLRRIIAKDPVANRQTVVKTLCEKMPHHSEGSWTNTLSRHKEMFEAIRAETLQSISTPEVHPPDPQQPRDASDAEMNEVDQAVDELDELQVGASLIPAEAEPMQDEQQPFVKEENKDESISDAHARDFEALVDFLTSADAEGGGEDEIFERLREKHVCVSAPSWSEFLEQHAAAVTEEVERRYATQQIS
ncbi:hypothetical protein EDB85DRAFT_483712 [Lactarius pseudohatsudake]|nr:hypothetical protein EDB85DRAFT_483712 [Lactarius pseudohatsudake]